MKLRLRHVMAVALALGIAASATFSGAQSRTRPKAHPTRPRKSAEAGISDAGVAPSRGASDAGSGQVVQQKTTDGGVKVFRFGEMEIEGRLKNPQLVFFLRRVRAEFAAGDLGHRSFMRELGETKQDPNF